MKIRKKKKLQILPIIQHFYIRLNIVSDLFSFSKCFFISHYLNKFDINCYKTHVIEYYIYIFNFTKDDLFSYFESFIRNVDREKLY